jgi:hypothetical protein
VTGRNSFKTARYRENGGTLITVTSDKTDSTEGTNNNARFKVERSEALPFATRVFFNIGGNAHQPSTLVSVTDPIDYNLTGMSIPFNVFALPFVDIPANQKSTTVTLAPINDTIHEGTETASFTVVPNAAYDIGTPGAVTLTIADKDHVILIGTLPRPPVLTTGLTRSRPAQAPRLFSDIRVNELN